MLGFIYIRELNILTFQKNMVYMSKIHTRILLTLIMTFWMYALPTDSFAKLKRPNGTEITIMAWGPCIDDANPSLKDFESIKECGFNYAFYYGNIKEIDKVCGYAERSYLNLLVGGSFLNKMNEPSDINRLNDMDVIKGWFLVDEPHYDRLQLYKERYDAIKRIAPDKLIYMNLVGGVIPKYTGPCSSMDQYLDTIQDIFSPDLWSYDYYPISVSNKKVSVNYYQFFSDLETFSIQAKKTGKPFWAFCQSMAFRNSSVERPAATEPYLKFEAFSALAYGAQGIVYWRYCQRVSEDEIFFSALVDLEGNKTPAWYAARQVNEEIKLYNDVFYGSNLLEYQHTGTLLVDKLTSSTKKFPYIQKMESGEYGFLLSHIMTDGKDYVVIVNHDVQTSQEINLTFEDNKHMILLLPKRGKNGIKEIKLKKYFNTVVEPGGYLILKVEKK